ncbi:MAG: helix-turn-helix transcriptional regulator [Prevotella sp.]|nr:helix-turn-helix transcriptional regulator [Selenomonadaceae bacterium]MBR6445782.1 helix-turn-helix transcriptional regulator [Prevotella sp.]
MKDRIKKIMESQHMTQQIFAQFIEVAPATLSSIFNDRTKPSLKIVDAIKQKIPALSTDWLLFGRGPMYTDEIPAEENFQPQDSGQKFSEPQLDFDASPTTFPKSENDRQVVNFAAKNIEPYVLKNIDKKPRQITEIRIFFDDQTWETFVPKK